MVCVDVSIAYFTCIKSGLNPYLYGIHMTNHYTSIAFLVHVTAAHCMSHELLCLWLDHRTYSLLLPCSTGPVHHTGLLLVTRFHCLNFNSTTVTTVTTATATPFTCHPQAYPSTNVTGNSSACPRKPSFLLPLPSLKTLLQYASALQLTTCFRSTCDLSCTCGLRDLPATRLPMDHHRA